MYFLVTSGVVHCSAVSASDYWRWNGEKRNPQENNEKRLLASKEKKPFSMSIINSINTMQIIQNKRSKQHYLLFLVLQIGEDSQL